MEEPRSYWAFISYRHLDNRETGREWATWIAREIETYEVPADLVGTIGSRGDKIPERIYPVFRDEDELSADADLSSPIYQALRQSKTIVVVCSPRAVESRYVGNEISYFKSLGNDDRVLAMMIEGEPHGDHDRECFPPALKHPVDSDGKIDTTREVEPVAADFRLPCGEQGWHGLEECRRNISDETAVEKYRQRCELAKLKVIAGILGVPLGKLIERDKAYQLDQARRRARVVARVAVAMAVLAALALIAGIFAWKQKQQADAERDTAVKARAVTEHAKRTAEQLIQEIVFDLEAKLQPLGKLELLDDVSKSAENYFLNLPEDEINADSQRARSAMMDARARIARAKGDLGTVLEKYRAGLAVSRKLAGETPDNHLYQVDLALSLQNVGDALLAENRSAEAQPLYLEAAEILSKEIEKALGANGAENVISALLGEHGEKLRSATLELLEESPGIAALLDNSVVLLERIADHNAATGDTEAAMARYRVILRVRDALTAAVESPEEKQVQQLQQVSTLLRIGNFQLTGGDPVEAQNTFEQILEIVETALGQDPENTKIQEKLTATLDQLATVALRNLRSEDAITYISRALEIWKKLAANDPGNNKRQEDLYVGFSKLESAQKAAGDLTAARTAFDESLRIARELFSIDPDNALWRQNLAYALERLARYQLDDGDEQTADTTQQKAIAHHQQLADGDPANLNYRRNLLIAINTVAVNHKAKSRFAEAGTAYKKSLQIAASILDDRVTPTWQSHKDLGDITYYLAEIFEQLQKPAEAANWYRQTLTVAQDAQMLELHDTAELEHLINVLNEKIAALETEQ